MDYTIIDTHAHLDGEEFKDDIDEVVSRARQAGVGKIFIPAINEDSIKTVPELCRRYPGYLYPMMGLQPEEVKDDYRSVLDKMHAELIATQHPTPSTPLNAPHSTPITQFSAQHPTPNTPLNTQHSTPITQFSAQHPTPNTTKYIAVGEVGLDFYWSRDYERQQLDAFERQMQWSIETRLPLMIHCRKAQNELLHIMRPYIDELPGGVFHCFTGNPREAERYMEFPRFVLGIGGVLTFKSSHLREDLPKAVPLSRIVLETDCPYMAPVPHRGERNESSFIVEVAKQLAASYCVPVSDVARQTTENVHRVFGDLAVV